MARLTKQQKAENEDRAQRGRNIMDAYACESGCIKDESNLCDLLADLMHRSAIDCEAQNFEAELDRARMHFDAEVKGED